MTFDRVCVLLVGVDATIRVAETTDAGAETRSAPASLGEGVAALAGRGDRVLIGIAGAPLPDAPTLPRWPAETDAETLLAPVSDAPLRADLAGADDETRAVRLSQALFALAKSGRLGPLLADAATSYLGERHGLALRAALPAEVDPPRLKNDCFAMPQGVDWVPVDAALDRLRRALAPIKRAGLIETTKAQGRILAAPAIARRSNPPLPNSAVDGYGFAHASTGAGPQRLPLIEGRAAAGQPFDGTVPAGAAIRILTGATVPEGVDTVVLEEDVALDGAAIVFDGSVKPSANTRRAGEDVAAGAVAIAAGRRMRAPELALASALGIAEVSVFEPLRVGVLSTGDEIIPSPAMEAAPHQIWDANRPMLLALAAGWGYEAVDLGHVDDDRDAIRRRLDAAAGDVDVILTSGGASAGDEDHVSALLRSHGTLSSWRIALKPGRPLALALWQGVPVFGLPGNPVAALVCALIFARPAFSLLAGGGWLDAPGVMVPAAFTKRKKAGRREYLRARLDAAGAAEVFKSEGSGRISGLSWAEGLVELPDEAVDIAPGTPVRFLPYAMLGLV